jgi:hypothetical protein
LWGGGVLAAALAAGFAGAADLAAGAGFVCFVTFLGASVLAAFALVFGAGFFGEGLLEDMDSDALVT